MCIKYIYIHMYDNGKGGIHNYLSRVGQRINKYYKNKNKICLLKSWYICYIFHITNMLMWLMLGLRVLVRCLTRDSVPRWREGTYYQQIICCVVQMMHSWYIVFRKLSKIVTTIWSWFIASLDAFCVSGTIAMNHSQMVVTICHIDISFHRQIWNVYELTQFCYFSS